MCAWAKDVQEEHKRVWELLYPFFLSIQKLTDEYYGTIEIIGSFASQLWIPSSDIDFLMIIPNGGSVDLFEDMTDQLYKKIGRLGYHSTIRLIRTYKLPLIKLVMSSEF